MANGKVEQIDLFESSEATSHGSPQAEECPPQIVEWFAPVPEEQEGFWLTKERLFSEIESCDTVCPMRENDGLHLVAQEMVAADFVPKNTTEQVIRFDEDEQLVVWEASCPDWQIPDVSAAYRFASDWMAHHPQDAVIVNEKTRRIVWRRSFGTAWVDGQEDMELLSYRYISEAMDGANSFLAAAQLALGGF